MGKWKINGTDISEEFGVFLKKGANDAFLRLPDMKEYLSEGCRESDGERAYVENPRMQARDITLNCYMVAGSAEALWTRRDTFLAFLKGAGLMDFELVRYNRTHKVYYKGCSSLSRISRINSGDVYITFALTLRETDPSDVYTKNLLSSEDSGLVLTEEGDRIEVLTDINR